MTNDDGQMTKEIRMTNNECEKACRQNGMPGLMPYAAVVVAACLFDYLPSTLIADERNAAIPTVDSILAAEFDRVPGPQSGGAALFPDPKLDWCDHTLWSQTVDFDGKKWRMWFVGMSLTSDPSVPYGMKERIGLATSSDGIHWKIANNGQPVVELGAPGKFDDIGMAHPYVLRVGDRFWMWYGGIDGRRGKDVGGSNPHVRVEQIGLATSRDGVRWTKMNEGEPVLRIGARGSIDSIQATGCHIIRRGEQYVMWYGAYDGTHRIGMATSPDGIHWTKGNNGEPVSGLRGQQQLGPSVHYDGHRYLMLYNTSWKSAAGPPGLWTLFAATSHDGVHWKPARDHQPLLGEAPSSNFGSAKGKRGNNHATHPSKLFFVDGRVRVWYGAEGDKPYRGRYPQNAIGLMEARLGAGGK
jgi:predicted GH43/DUF377 family glycosyl hydrolase